MFFCLHYLWIFTLFCRKIYCFIYYLLFYLSSSERCRRRKGGRFLARKKTYALFGDTNVKREKNLRTFWGYTFLCNKLISAAYGQKRHSDFLWDSGNGTWYTVLYASFIFRAKLTPWRRYQACRARWLPPGRPSSWPPPWHRSSASRPPLVVAATAHPPPSA